MARILGLDLGSYAVRGVLFDATLRGYTTRAYAEVRRPEGTPQESLSAALKELLASQSLEADQVIVSLPGPSLVTHTLTLPFTDFKRLEAALPFEVESQLPFDLSQALFDYQVVDQKEKSSDLLVGVVRKEEMSSLLALLAEQGIDPRVVTHPGLAFQNLLSQLPQLFDSAPPQEAVAILDLGHERTTVAIGRVGVGVEVARTLSAGGRDLSRALAAEFQTPLPEAHHWKESHGAVGSAAQGPEVQRAAAALLRGMQPLLRELRPTFKAFTARTRRQVSTLYICGGTSLLPGIDEQLSRDLGIPVQRLALPQEASAFIPEAQHGIAAQAYSLALRGQVSGARAPRFNLRRGEFAFKGHYDYVKERLSTLVALAAGLLLLLILSGFVRNSVLASREEEVDDLLCETTQRILGTCERNYDRALNLLKGKESPIAALPKMSAVNLLAAMTSQIPSDLPVRLERIEVDTDRIAVHGESDNSKQIDTLSQALKAHPCFDEVKEGKVSKARDGQKFTFRLDVQVSCPESVTEGEG